MAVWAAPSAQELNGFDLSDSLVPVDEILEGGPPRDGIRALTDPERVSREQADDWLEDDDRVIGVAIGKQAVAYPQRILTYRELVNDVVGGRPVAVTYCPLCRSAMVFDSRLEGERALFGVSGLLYQSDMLLFERSSDSLFSQLMMQAVTGPLRGTELRILTSSSTTWRAWRERHPETEVLTPILPHGYDYGTDLYADYHSA